MLRTTNGDGHIERRDQDAIIGIGPQHIRPSLAKGHRGCGFAGERACGGGRPGKHRWNSHRIERNFSRPAAVDDPRHADPHSGIELHHGLRSGALRSDALRSSGADPTPGCGSWWADDGLWIAVIRDFDG